MLRKKISNLFNVKISRGYLYFILKKNNIVRLKVNYNKYPHNDKKFNEAKNKLKKELQNVNKNVISIDETSVDISIASNYGFAKKGTKCVINKIFKRKRFTVIMAMTKRKILDYKIVPNSSNGETFMSFIKEQIVPKTKKALFMDNARIHHYKKFTSYVNSIKRKVIYNVPYTPIYNPIEYVFNNLKMYLRQHTFNNINQLDELLRKFKANTNIKGVNNHYNKSICNLFGDD